jgi:hypothetical protein
MIFSNVLAGGAPVTRTPLETLLANKGLWLH